MAYVVTEACINCKYTDCVTPCPVDCFREGTNMLVIDPDECIDCGLCVPECPVNAIFYEEDVPDKWKPYIKLNALLSKGLNWPMINIKKREFEHADYWATIVDKNNFLIK